MIGDSLAVGLAPHMTKLAAGCTTPFHEKGEVRISVTKAVKDSWLLPAVQAANANVALVVLGGNDFMRNDPARVKSSIRQLISKLRAAGMRVLWVAPPTMPFPDKIGVRQMWMDALGGDWYDSEQLSIPRVPGDPLGHPTYQGAKSWAAHIWPWMATHIGG